MKSSDSHMVLSMIFVAILTLG